MVLCPQSHKSPTESLGILILALQLAFMENVTLGIWDITIRLAVKFTQNRDFYDTLFDIKMGSTQSLYSLRLNLDQYLQNAGSIIVLSHSIYNATIRL